MLAADWLEAGVLVFDPYDEGLTQPEVVDYLIEQHIYEDQDHCAEFVESIFAEIRARMRCGGGGYPVSIDTYGRLLGNDAVALSFCLLLSILSHYSGYTTWVAGNYVEQGELFELLTEESMAHTLPGWEVRRTGWGGGQVTSLPDLLNIVAEITRESVAADAPQFIGDDEKDFGLDIAAVRPFGDGRPALLVIFGQCASGENWTEKFHAPNTSRWKDLLTLTHTPLRAISFPFRLDERAYTTRRSQYQGLVMDRLRLLPPEPESVWLSDDLRSRIEDWTNERADWLRARYSAGAPA
jgi:hypothetical protein